MAVHRDGSNLDFLVKLPLDEGRVSFFNDEGRSFFFHLLNVPCEAPCFSTRPWCGRTKTGCRWVVELVDNGVDGA